MAGGLCFRAAGVAWTRGPLARAAAVRAARRLRRLGVREAVFPADWPHAALFAKYGVVPPSAVPLHRATAAAIVRRCLDGAPGTPVRLRGTHVSRELMSAAFALAGEVRYLTLDVPGGEALAAELHREYGLAADAPYDGALEVCFDAADTPGALPLADPALHVEYELPAGLDAGGMDTEQLLAALCLAGKLDGKALRVLRVEA